MLQTQVEKKQEETSQNPVIYLMSKSRRIILQYFISIHSIHLFNLTKGSQPKFNITLPHIFHWEIYKIVTMPVTLQFLKSITLYYPVPKLQKYSLS